MAHTSIINLTTFIHNGDYSGDVEILQFVPDANAPLGKRVVNEVTVPFEDIRQFVFDYLAKRMVAKIENASADEMEEMLLKQK